MQKGSKRAILKSDSSKCVCETLHCLWCGGYISKCINQFELRLLKCQNYSRVMLNMKVPHLHQLFFPFVDVGKFVNHSADLLD